MGEPDQAHYRRFETVTGSRFGTVRAKWRDPLPHTWGCQITVSRDLEAVIVETVSEIKAVMNWQ